VIFLAPRRLGLFFILTPDKILKFKERNVSAAKLTKGSIAAVFCAHAGGTEKKKKKVLANGQSKNPRCFKNVKSLSVCYWANKKTWMTSDLFQPEMRHWHR
jgi:hypothetical protein